LPIVLLRIAFKPLNLWVHKKIQGEFYNFQFENIRTAPCANKGPNLGTNPIANQRNTTLTVSRHA
jgi:hypothetical protein